MKTIATITSYSYRSLLVRIFGKKTLILCIAISACKVYLHISPYSIFHTLLFFRYYIFICFIALFKAYLLLFLFLITFIYIYMCFLYITKMKYWYINHITLISLKNFLSKFIEIFKHIILIKLYLSESVDIQKSCIKIVIIIIETT